MVVPIPLKSGRVLRGFIDDLVGKHDGGVQPVGCFGVRRIIMTDRLRAFLKIIAKHLYRQLACGFSGRVSAHAVGHDSKAESLIEINMIFVFGAYQTLIGFPPGS